jgi:hypothetical protein
VPSLQERANVERDRQIDTLWQHVMEQQRQLREQQRALLQEQLRRRRLEIALRRATAPGVTSAPARRRLLLPRLVAVAAALVWALAPGITAASAPALVWQLMPNMPTGRSSLGAATGPGGLIYTVGGDDTEDSRLYVDTVEAYNPRANNWLCSTDDVGSSCFRDTIPPMPMGRAGLAAATASDGQIYAFGGVGNSASPAYRSTVEAYNAITNSWTCSVGDTGTGCTAANSLLLPMPTARANTAAVTAPDGKIYVIGGDSGSSPFSTVEAYDPTTNSWACSQGDTNSGCSSSTIAPMPTARALLGAAAGPDGRLYAIGGWVLGSGYLAVVEAYDPTTNTWICSEGDSSSGCTGGTTLAPLPSSLASFGIATGADGLIYVIGGYDGDTNLITATVDAYDTQANTWNAETPRTFLEQRLAAALGPDGLLYAFGGSDNSVEAASTEGAGQTGIGQVGVVGLESGRYLPDNSFHAGVYGYGTYGGVFGGTTAQLHLIPGNTVGHPTSGTFAVGDLYLDSAGSLFLCTGSGAYGSGSTPTWVELSANEVTDARVARFRSVVRRGWLDASWTMANKQGIAGFSLRAGQRQLTPSLSPPHAGQSYHVRLRYAGHASITLHVILTGGNEVTIRPG